jgi:tetratricopeptide (TPR) repeat protein
MENNEVISDGDKLRTIRAKYNLKQDELSGKDITRNLISEIETGTANITKKTAEVVIKNLKEIGKRKHIEVTETVEYLMENQLVQATKILDDYIEELKTLVISKDGSFMEILKRAESFLIDWDIKDKKLSIYELAGDYYCNNNEMCQSAVYYEKAAALLSKMFLDKKLLTISRKLSIVYGRIGNYKKSIESCEFALNCFEDMSQKDRVIFIFNNALNYFNIKKFQKSLNNLKTAESIVSKDDDMYIKILNNKASCLYEINKKQESLRVFNELSRIIDKNNLEDYLVNLTNIIHVCMEIGLKDEAIEKCHIVTNQLVNLNEDNVCTTSIYFEMGKIYTDFNKIELSEEYYLKALDFAEKQKNYILANEILNNLIDMYIKENNIGKMNSIKEKVFFIAVKREKIDNLLMYKLIEFYDKIGSGMCKEIAHFALKFN